MVQDDIFDIRITQESKISWFDVRQLAATAAKSVAATIVGPMSGRREIMAALSPIEHKLERYECGEDDTFWFDYISDCGDGWNASHSVAWLIGRDGIALDPDGAPTPQPLRESGFQEELPEAEGNLILPAGKVLICGGDQVYPTASAYNYRARFIDVMKSARTWQKPSRDLYAIPGNHDWYDGLTHFIRLFCQSEDKRRWFGAWRATQRRSYFAVKLPHGFWLWGLDMALEDDLDPPQIEYFSHWAKQLDDGDQVILCVPAPSWLKHKPGDKEVAKLDIVLDIANHGRETDNRVPLILTGDHHYYARHRAKLPRGDREYIICGGGGAFTLGTTEVPQFIDVSEFHRKAGTATLESSFPDHDQSIEARRGVFRFPWASPGFTGALAGLQLMLLWLLSAPLGVATDTQCGAVERLSWIKRNMCSDFGLPGFESILSAGLARLGSPGTLMVFVLLLAGFGAFALSGAPSGSRKRDCFLIGAAHGLAHCTLGLVTIWLVAQLAMLLAKSLAPWTPWFVTFVSFAILFLMSGWLFAAYLFLSHKFLRMHDQEVYSAQGIERFKSFLRLKIDEKGLTVYPVGLLEPSRQWRKVPEVTAVSKEIAPVSRAVTYELQAPKGCHRLFDPTAPLAPQLIEKPIEIVRSTTRRNTKARISHAT